MEIGRGCEGGGCRVRELNSRSRCRARIQKSRLDKCGITMGTADWLNRFGQGGFELGERRLRYGGGEGRRHQLVATHNGHCSEHGVEICLQSRAEGAEVLVLPDQRAQCCDKVHHTHTTFRSRDGGKGIPRALWNRRRLTGGTETFFREATLQ